MKHSTAAAMRDLLCGAKRQPAACPGYLGLPVSGPIMGSEVLPTLLNRVLPQDSLWP